jgi:hypothetical protein
VSAFDCGNNALLKRAAAEEVMKKRLKGIYNITGRKGGVPLQAFTRQDMCDGFSAYKEIK